MLTGILAITSALFVPRLATMLLIISGVGSALFLVGYSFFVWKRDPAQNAVR
jgi:hypothetical protein